MKEKSCRLPCNLLCPELDLLDQPRKADINELQVDLRKPDILFLFYYNILGARCPSTASISYFPVGPAGRKKVG
jgi:hypothetical protein